ncbi:hypothetical protein KM043_009149 [Ampulex compressa]|nr:hypothetical protein KM043_009149 [Ampulex compressa]
MPAARVLLYVLLNSLLVTLIVARSVTGVVDKKNLKLENLEEDDQKDGIVAFNLEETYGQSFRAYSFNGTWKSDTEIIYTDADTGDLLEFDVTTKDIRIILEESVTNPYGYCTISLSHDKSYVLIGYDTQSGFRHSTYRKYAVYSIKDRTYVDIANGMHIPLVVWSPTKNALVYVMNNDIYYKVLPSNDRADRRLTTNGEYGIVYNGVPDWVYEEEVLGKGSALWFSPDGQHLAFASFNDTGVKDAAFFYYGEPGSLKYQYPTEVKIKYPKAGTPNPAVSLTLVDLSNPSSKLVNLEAPTNVVGTDHILYTVSWWNEKRVVAMWTNRIQNKGQMVMYDHQGYARHILYQKEPHGWLIVRPPVYHDDFIFVLKFQDSHTLLGRFMHITRYEYVDGELTKETDLTPGPSEVQSIVSVDHDRGKVYYLATAVGAPSQRNLYSVPLDGSQNPICISCGFLTPEGNNCTYASAAFSKDKSHYVLSCSGPDPGIVKVLNLAQEELVVWEDNEEMRKKLSYRLQPRVKNTMVMVNGYDCKVRLLLPPNFDEKKSYPLLINVYSGPNTVRITDAASYGLQSYMTTNRSVIYGWIDGRGSAYKGSKMLFEIYRGMGTVEVQDQIDVTRTLQAMYSWIDSKRTAIWGWSYGGFATAMVLATDKHSVFKCGISVAPVTSWIYYDSIYTERFMSLPTVEDNLLGYNETDITRKVEGIRGKKFMLIHGTKDDNVHYQQARALSKSLADADILFEEVSYTDEAHGLTGVSPHLYHTMDRFWSNCFGWTH